MTTNYPPGVTGTEPEIIGDDMSEERWTREEFDQIVETVKADTVESLIADGELLPMAHVLSHRHPETGKHSKGSAVVVMQFTGPEEKNAALDLVRDICRKCDAPGVVHAYEMWVYPMDHAAIREAIGPEVPEDPAEFGTWLRSNFDRVRDQLPRRELAIVIGEYMRSHIMWCLPYTRDPDGKPVPGQWQLTDADPASELTHLLPGARGC